MKASAPKVSSQLLTPAEAGRRASCSDDHIYRLVAAGELAAVDIALPGSQRSKTRIREDDLVAYIDRQTRRSRAARAPVSLAAGTGRAHQAAAERPDDDVHHTRRMRAL